MGVAGAPYCSSPRTPPSGQCPRPCCACRHWQDCDPGGVRAAAAAGLPPRPPAALRPAGALQEGKLEGSCLLRWLRLLRCSAGTACGQYWGAGPIHTPARPPDSTVWHVSLPPPACRTTQLICCAARWRPRGCAQKTCCACTTPAARPSRRVPATCRAGAMPRSAALARLRALQPLPAGEQRCRQSVLRRALARAQLGPSFCSSKYMQAKEDVLPFSSYDESNRMFVVRPALCRERRVVVTTCGAAGEAGG